jgi:hypothetical protein
MSKVKVIRQPTAEETLIFEFETASSNFWLRILRMVIFTHLWKGTQQKNKAY